MLGKFVLTLLLLVSSLAAQAANPYPPDVRNFIAKREDCEHFLGEIPEPEQKHRMREVMREIKVLCTGTDRRLAKLKKKYANNPPVLKRLAEFDTRIEG